MEDYLSLMVIMLSFLAMLFCLFVFWLLLTSYRFYNRYSLIITEMAKGLKMSTARLERLPKILFNEEIVFREKTFSTDQFTKEQEIEKE